MSVLLKKIALPVVFLWALVVAPDAITATSAASHRQVSSPDGQHSLHLAFAGNQQSPLVVFVHGSPGSWNGWEKYLDDMHLREVALMVAVDRPGFGGSNDGSSGLSLKAQSDSIMSAVATVFPEKHNVIVVGHSYGAPVAVRMAVDYPERVASTLLLAPAMDPEIVRVRWYNKLVGMWLFRWMLPDFVTHSNNEMMLLPQELATMEPLLHLVRAPTTVIQGDRDKLVLPGNADFVKKALTNARVDVSHMPKAGHLLPWKEFDKTKNALLSHIVELANVERAKL